MKKLVSLILAFLMCLSVFACTYTPPPEPVIPEPEEEEEEEYIPEEGEEKEFDSAIDAFLYGEKYFNEEAAFYETVQYGTATAMGIGTYVMTKRYKSDVTNNFLYETNTIGTKIMGIDPTFALKSYKEHDNDTIFYARVDGTDVPNGAYIDTQYSSASFKAGKSVFESVEISKKPNWNEYKNEVGGNIPDTLSVYIINESTIKDVLSFEEDVDGFKYVFKLSLNEGAVVDYKKQVLLCSGQTYFRFNPLDLNDGLVLKFYMDKYGRILRLDLEENYTVDTGSAKATVINKSTEYFSYNKRPQIEFIDENGTFTGPTITPAALPSGDDEKIEQYKISFDTQGGSACDDVDAFYNTEVGLLPETSMEGYEFAGWFTKANGEGERFNERTLFTLREDLTLYAYWYFIDPDGEGTFALINDGAEYLIVKGNESVEGEFIIPSEYKGKPITAVGVDAYRANTTITKLFVHNKIKTIEAGAFYGCTNITSIEFEEDSILSVIGDEAFRGLTKLEGIDIPSSVSSIGIGAFRALTNAGFNRIFIPANVERLGSSAFYGCSNVKEIVFEKGSKLTVLEDELFRGCTNMNLERVSIPVGITEIGKGVFNGTRIKEVEFEGGNVIRIGEEAFYNCSGLTSIEIPASVVLIDVNAFGLCSNLVSVTFDGGNLETIGKDAFANCRNITSIRIPASVTQIGENAFGGCTALASVSFAAGSNLSVIGAKAFYNCNNITSIKIPSTVVSVGNEAFTRAGTALTGLKNLEFAYGSVLETIGSKAFERSSITVLDLPDSVKTIGDNAFSGITALERINIGTNSSLESIGLQAFLNCSNALLESITIPSKVNSIGGGAFAGTSITELILKTNEFVLKDGVLYTASFDAVVLSIPSLVTADTKIDERVERILDYAFYNCTELDVESVPESVVEIGIYAFNGCTGLTKMNLHDNIKSVGIYAFYGCVNLEEFVFSNSLTEISNYILYNCKKITSIVVPDKVERIGQNSFRNTGLIEVVIPSSVKTIDSNAFMGCLDLTSVTLNEGLKTIGNAAFSGCVSLASVELPQSLISMGNAFTNCSKLEEVIVNRYKPLDEENPITMLTGNAFSNTNALLKIIIPTDSFEAYSVAANWKTHASKILEKTL